VSELGQIARFYSRWSAVYDRLATGFPGIGPARRAAADALALSPGDTVVEMGCGTGANLPHLRERVGDAGTVVGVDVAPGALGRAHRRATRAGWANVNLVRGDAARPPVRSADAVLGAFVTGMFGDPESVVGEWCARADRVALLEAAPADGDGFGTALANLGFRAFTRLANPGRLARESPARRIDARVGAARSALRERSSDVTEVTFLGGLVTVTAGSVPAVE
jgi:ubiquinone/menaquinone biosynthesis C-methylase UbiE